MNRATATWVSASSISSFRNCPKSYYWANIFRLDGQKISTVSPHLLLGLATHGPLENLAYYPSEERKTVMFAPEFRRIWKEGEGEKSGFTSKEQEDQFKLRGRHMLERAKANIHHLEGETCFLTKGETLPTMELSLSDEIMLSGRVDYILKGLDNYKVIDFKTSESKEESPLSLQLHIYKILLNHYLKSGENMRGFFWYLNQKDDPTERLLPSLSECTDMVMEMALKIKQAKKNNEFECPRGAGGCFACRPYQMIADKDPRMKMVGKGLYGSLQFAQIG